MATSHCFNGFWRLTRLSPTTTAESEHDVHVAVIALYRHWRGAELTRPALLSDPPYVDNSGVRRELLKGTGIKGGPR
jgi:hypothetical protein